MEGDQKETLTSSSVHRNPSATDGFDLVSVASTHVSKSDKKIEALKQVLELDIEAADVKWSLFVAACQGYRYDSCLRPFPPQYLSAGLKDIDDLRDVVDRTPTLTLLLENLHNSDVHQPDADIVDLVHWVLVGVPEPELKSVPKEEFGSVLKLVPSDIHAQPPNLIFQAVWDHDSPSEVKWSQLTAEYKTLFAYHGSRLENFHSILHYGLQQHMNKNSLFGHGIYLSSELAVSLPYSPSGYGWGGSEVGSELSCVALCEVLDHPDVKCQNQDTDRSRSITTDSIGGEVPKKYYVVLNSDLVRIRYLLVYCSSAKLNRPETTTRWFGWMRRHKFIAFLLGYVIILTAVGLSNNQFIQRYYKSLLRRAKFF